MFKQTYVSSICSLLIAKAGIITFAALCTLIVAILSHLLYTLLDTKKFVEVIHASYDKYYKTYSLLRLE